MERTVPASTRISRALTIAGSDSGGCAGIQADLKTFAALGVHGMSVITSITAQDTCTVHATEDVSTRLIAQQIDATLSDIGANAVKTGMLPSSSIVSIVVKKIREFKVTNLVVDPVMVSTGGNQLIREGAIDTVIQELLPRTTILTPNLPEAETLLGTTLDRLGGLREAAKQLYELGPESILIKGGHSQDPNSSNDLFFDGSDFLELKAQRFDTKNTHGSGCTLSAALAAYLALGHDLREAAVQAKTYVSKAINQSLDLGYGHGPLGHFFEFWKR